MSHARPRLSAARAFLAGAAMLAGAAAPSFSAAAQDLSEDMAMAVPRLAPAAGGVVALPRPLPASVARLARLAFEDPAAPLDGLLETPVLGHVLAARYLASANRAGVEALRDWLEQYATLPDAEAVHALLCSRLPHGVAIPAAPFLPRFTAAAFGDDVETADRLLARNPGLDRGVRDAARAGQFDRALRQVGRTRGLSPEYGALLRAEVARAMFSQGQDMQALVLAEAAHQQAHGAVGLAPWIAGLSAWRLGRLTLARSLFEAAYRARLAAPGQRAGAAFWAARASLVTRGEHGPWMHRAARDARTFYGLLARRVLGQSVETAGGFDRDTLAEADVEAISATARGERAFALLQVGQSGRAAAELRLLFTETREQPGFGRSILLVARTAGLVELAGQLEGVLQPASVRLPTRALRPAGGFQLDPALIYALTRLESNFDAAAVSPSGAQGLMQLMPGTAQFMMAGKRTARPLHDPGTNLDVGQRYLLHLSQLDVVGGDLVRLLATYNAGPGTMGRWLESMAHEDDPLLFIESLPGEETRGYVPRALAYTWLYAAQLGLASPSLDDLAAGLWPTVPVRTARRDRVAGLN